MARALFCYTLTGLLMAGGSDVASGSEKAQESHPCAAVAGSSERLACFDKSFPPGPQATAALAEASRQNFGLVQKKETVKGAEQIDAALAAVTYASGGLRLFEFDNGQVWRETEVNRMGMLKKGDKVTIREGALSSFLLITPGGASIRVKRVK